MMTFNLIALILLILLWPFEVMSKDSDSYLRAGFEGAFTGIYLSVLFVSSSPIGHTPDEPLWYTWLTLIVCIIIMIDCLIIRSTRR